MKIDKRNYKHWLYLLRSGLIILLLLPLRLVKKPEIVLLYGHKLNGNLSALYDYILANKPELEVYCLTLDPAYYSQLKSDGIRALHMGSLTDMAIVARGSLMVTDHGLHTLRLYLLLTSMKFVDVWHGIPYKGFDADTFKHLHKHDQVWVSSEHMRDIYEQQYGFSKEQLKVTGYGRVDRLFLGDYKKDEILSRFELKNRRTVLVAPTWAQDQKGRSITPFDASIKDFFDVLEAAGRKLDSTIIFRAHLNSGDDINTDDYEYVRVMPYAKYPLAEEFLYIADVLVTDWSSIAFDYLALRRPTIFLDVPAPFAKGFTLGPEHRFGEVVGSLEELKASIEWCVDNPDEFNSKYSKNMEETIKVAYGDTLDGRATERYLKNLEELLAD